nr:ribosomal protein S20 [Cyanidium caldarium]
MANSKSAKKNIKITERNKVLNQINVSCIKALTKKYLRQINNDSFESNLLNTLYSKIDKAAKMNVFHKNKANRLKSKLIKKLSGTNAYKITR